MRYSQNSLRENRSMKLSKPTQRNGTVRMMVQLVNAANREKTTGNRVNTAKPRKFGSRKQNAMSVSRCCFFMAFLLVSVPAGPPCPAAGVCP